MSVYVISIAMIAICVSYEIGDNAISTIIAALPPFVMSRAVEK